MIFICHQLNYWRVFSYKKIKDLLAKNDEEIIAEVVVELEKQRIEADLELRYFNEHSEFIRKHKFFEIENGITEWIALYSESPEKFLSEIKRLQNYLDESKGERKFRNKNSLKYKSFQILIEICIGFFREHFKIENDRFVADNIEKIHLASRKFEFVIE